jgi:signal transduction histidine kinase
MLLALAVHRQGAGFDRAHLLVWNVDRAALEGRLSWLGSRTRRPVGEALRGAQRQASEGTDPESTRKLRSIRFAAEDLDGPLTAAWSGGASTMGDAPGSGGYLWTPGAPLGVAALDGGGQGYGLIVGEWSGPGEPARRAAALETLRHVGNAALESYRLAEESRRWSDQGAALVEFARAGVSPLNLAEALNLVVKLATQASGARGGALWTVGKDGTPVLQTTHGPAGTRERLARALRSLVVAALERGRPVTLDRLADEPALGPQAAGQMSALAALPLIAHGRPRGALVVYDRASFHPADSMAFDRIDLVFLRTLADQAALVLEQASTADALGRAEQRRQELLKRLARSERLAALGEQSARMAQETRNPLASIGAFARRAHRHLAEGHPAREYLEVILRETERLERMMHQQSQTVIPGAPRLRMESVNAMIQATLQQMGEPLARRRVRLLKKLSADAPPLLLDAERIGRALSNILAHALESVSPGGRIRVESRRVQQHVVVDVAHDGATPPGELLDQLFVPFAVGLHGAGVGLAVAQQIVQQHGGEIRVRSEGEWSSIFSFTLPIHDNEDRRRPGQDRRISRRDRRERFPMSEG